MTSNYLLKISVLVTLFLCAAACGGRSDIAGEIVPIENICSYGKSKPVAVEGYIAAKTMQCEKVRGKKTTNIIGCTFAVYSNDKYVGASIPVYVLATSWMSAKNNRIDDPASYTGDLQFYDGKGNPLPKKDLQIYDNDGNLIPPGSKMRFYSVLPDSDKCEFRMAERIEQTS